MTTRYVAAVLAVVVTVAAGAAGNGIGATTVEPKVVTRTETVTERVEVEILPRACASAAADLAYWTTESGTAAEDSAAALQDYLDGKMTADEAVEAMTWRSTTSQVVDMAIDDVIDACQ